MYDVYHFLVPTFLRKEWSLFLPFHCGTCTTQLASWRKITNQNQREDLEVLVLALAMEEAGDLQTSNKAPLEWRSSIQSD